MRLFANYSTNFWMTASRSFIIEAAYCEREKIINLTILKVYPAKLTRTSFAMKSRFSYVIIALRKKCPHLSLFSLDAGKCRSEQLRIRTFLGSVRL